MKNLIDLIRHLRWVIGRWNMDELYRKDVNWRRWHVKTEDISGSHCGCCGAWIPGDPGPDDLPPTFRWSVCPICEAM